MTKSSVDEAGAQDADAKARRRDSWVLLVIHSVAFLALLSGFILRVRYVEAEGVQIDWIAVVLAIVGTVVFIVLLALLLVFRRRAALRRELVKAGFHGPLVLAYWSRTSTPPFLTDDAREPRGRGLDVAVTADADGLHVRALVRRRLIDFGLIPWSHLTIDAGAKAVGVGVLARGGVLRISLAEHTPPYTDRIEFFPAGQTGVDAARVLSASR